MKNKWNGKKTSGNKNALTETDWNTSMQVLHCKIMYNHFEFLCAFRTFKFDKF